MSTDARQLSSHNPIDPQFNPYPAWAEQRADVPVVPIEGMDPETPIYLILSWELVEQVLRDPETFSSKSNAVGIGQIMGPMIVGMDGEQHRRYRNIVAYAFRPSAIERTEAEIVRPIVDGLLDEFAADGRAEMVSQFTSRFPVRIIAAMLGASADDYDQIHHWAEEINLGPAAPDRSLPAAAAMREYLEPIVADRRAHRRDDLISDIVHAEVDGEHLDDEHIYGFLRLLFPAGAETTYRVSGSLLAGLLTHANAYQRVRDDRSLVTPFIEEALRWETAVTVVSRETTREVELGGVTIPKGAALLPSPGAANRDPQHFDHADDFDPDRPLEPHMSFGTGRHQCLGMHLARTEMRVALEAVLDRLPGLRLDPDFPAPAVTGFAFRGPDHLNVLFEPS